MRFLSIHDFHRGTDYIFTLVRGKVLRSHMTPTPPLGRIVDRDAALPRPADFPLQRRRVGRHTLLLQLFLPSFTLFLLALHASHGVKALGVPSISPCHQHISRCEGTLFTFVIFISAKSPKLARKLPCEYHYLTNGLF